MTDKNHDLICEGCGDVVMSLLGGKCSGCRNPGHAAWVADRERLFDRIIMAWVNGKGVNIRAHEVHFIGQIIDDGSGELAGKEEGDD